MVNVRNEQGQRKAVCIGVCVSRATQYQCEQTKMKMMNLIAVLVCVVSPDLICSRARMRERRRSRHMRSRRRHLKTQRVVPALSTCGGSGCASMCAAQVARMRTRATS